MNLRYAHVVVAIILLIFIASFQNVWGESLPVRTIKLHLAVDKEFRSLSGWEGIIGEVVKNVSLIYENNFQIRFEIAKITPWNPDASTVNPEDLVRLLKKQIGREEADLLIGFSGRACEKKNNGIMHGAAVNFSSLALAMTECGDSSNAWRSIVLSHELAHLFGAFHVANSDSVMAVNSPQYANVFDEQNTKVIYLMRDFDFSRSMAGINKETIKEILNIFAVSHAEGDINPVAAGYYNFGSDLSDDGKYEEAITAYKEAIKIEPKFSQAYYNLGVALQRKNVYNKEAILNEAVSAYREAIKLDLKFINARYNIGVIFIEQGKYKEAVSELGEVLKIDPNMPEAHAYLGVALRKQGKAAEAIKEFKESIRLKPSFALSYDELGMILTQQEKYDEAILEYKRSIQISPNGATPHNYLGTTLVRKGKMDEALKEFQEAVRLSPNYVEAHFNLGLIYFAKGNNEKAISEFKESLRIRPSYVKAKYYIGRVLSRQQKYPEAISIFNEVLRSNPEMLEARLYLGVAIGSQGKYNEAITEIRKAEKMRPDDGEPHYYMGWYLILSGQYKEAWKEIKLAQKLGYKVPVQVIDMLKSKHSEP